MVANGTRRGSALLVAVIVVMVVVGLSAAYLAATSAFSYAMSEQIAREQALQVAEAAVDNWIKQVEEFRAAHQGTASGSVFTGVLGVDTAPTAQTTKPTTGVSPSLLSSDPDGEWAVMNSMSDDASPWTLADATGRAIGNGNVVPTDWATDGVDNDDDGVLDSSDSDEMGQFTLRATGRSSGTTITIEVTVGPRPESPFSVGLFGDKRVRVDHEALTDSYRSHPAGDLSGAPLLYDVATAGDQGDVGSNGRMKIKKDAEINGFVRTSGVREWRVGDKAPFHKKLIDIDKNAHVVGDVEAGHGTIRIKKEAQVDGAVGTSDGNVRIDRDSVVGGDVDTANGDVVLKDNVHVLGHASPGPGMTADLGKDVVVDGGVAEGAYGPEVPEVVFPPAPSGDGIDASLFTLASPTSNNNPTVTVTKGKKTETVPVTTLDVTSGVMTLPPGNYYFDKVTVAKGAQLVFTGDTNLVVAGDLTVHDDASLSVRGNANIAVGSKVDTHRASTFTVEGNTAVAVTGDLKLRGFATFGSDATKTTTIDVQHHFDIKHEADVHFRGPTVLESDDRFRTGNHASVQFGDAVTVFAEKRLDMRHANLDQLPDATRAFFFAGSEATKDGGAKVRIEVPSGSDFFGTVYAPKAKIDVRYHHQHHDLATAHTHDEAADDKKDLDDGNDDDDDDLDDDKKDGKNDADDEYEEDDDPDKSKRKKDEEAEDLAHPADPKFANFMGAVIGWDIRMKKGIRFHYDESLGEMITLPSNEELVVIGWRRTLGN